MSENFAYEYSSSGGCLHPWGREFPQAGGFPAEAASRAEFARGGELFRFCIGVIGDRLFVSSLDLWQDSGFGWQHRRTFCSAMESGGRFGVLGPGWILADMPFLVGGTTGEKGAAWVGVVGSMASVIGFEADGLGGWRRLEPGTDELVHDTVGRSFCHRNADGLGGVFHSFEPGLARQLRGRLKALEDARGTVARVEYGENDEIARVVWRSAGGGVDEMQYGYLEGGISPLLRSVTWRSDGQAMRRVSYAYHKGGQAAGMLRECRTEAMRGDAWKAEGRVSYEYGLSRRLRRVEIREPTAEAGASVEALSRRGKYTVRYDERGGVKWIRHQGMGAPPVFLD